MHACMQAAAAAAAAVVAALFFIACRLFVAFAAPLIDAFACMHYTQRELRSD